MKTITVTEKQVRDALGVSGYSPLAERLINSLFDNPNRAVENLRTELLARISRLETAINSGKKLRGGSR